MLKLLRRGWAVLVITSAGLVAIALLLGRLLPDDGRLAYTSEYLGSTEIHLVDISRGFLFNLSWGGVPVWSPDGRYMAYVTGNRANQDIFVMGANGADTRNLTADSPHDLSPTWSPDSQHLAFESNRDGNWEIYLIDMCDGCDLNPRNLTHNAAIDSSPSWSPDGRRIAFISTRSDESEIFVMNADGSNLHRLTRHSLTDLQVPVWSPDGKQLAFTSLRPGNWDIYVMDADCGDLPECRDDRIRNLSQHTSQDSNPAWSPDGKWIAFTSRRDGNLEVYLVAAEGGEPRNLTNNPNEDSSPAWSPDSKQLAFQTNRDRLYSDEIYVIDIVNGATERLTYSYGSHQYPAWWPN
jgi:Tol biopolymer transport system component